MEIKEMTKEEIFAYLNNTKLICTSSEETVKVQKKLFELGFEWDTGEKIKQVDKYLLFIEGEKLKFTLDFEYWVRCQQHKRIELNEILAIQIKEEKPKFDPKTLEDFQKVLYRSSSADWWRLGFFEYYNEKLENKFWIVGQDVQPYEQCVPYNEETKSLVGTTEEAPEFYRI